MTSWIARESGDGHAGMAPVPHSRILLLALALIVAAGPALAADAPEIAGVQVGFAGRYKVGVWTPLQAIVRGGKSPAKVRVVASLSDSDGLNCAFDSEPCEALRARETAVSLCVRFGREASAMRLELLDGETPLAARTFASSPVPSAGQFPDGLRSGQRLIVSLGAAAGSMDNALPSSEGKSPRNVIAAVENIADLPDRWQGYEGVDYVVLSTSRREFLAQATANASRIEALDQWVRAGGTLVLCAGENAEEALSKKSPLARFVPGRYDTTLHFHSQDQIGAWETLAGGHNPISPANPGERKVDLPVAGLTAVRGSVAASVNKIPLLIRAARGLGEVVFVATDLDRGPIRAWNDRPLLLAAILGLPPNEPPVEVKAAVESYGFDDLAGQLRSSLEQFRGVRLVPFFVVALLIALYILLIGPGDYFLLRRLRRMQWTWLSFPAVVVVFVAGGYWASSWLKRDLPRVNQVDLIDIASDGTARGTSWFSIFSPRAETFDLSVHPLAGGKGSLSENVSLDAASSPSASIGWFGKAGNGFNGMYNRDIQNTGPFWGQGYSIGPALSSARNVPVQEWSCKSFVCRWLGRGDQDVQIELRDENRQPAGTITNNLKCGGHGVQLAHAYLACDGWAYVLGTIRPGETVDVSSTTRRISLNTFLSSESMEDHAPQGEKADKLSYDPASRDAAYVLRAMLFYDSASGRRRTGMANEYQDYVDLSGVFRTGRAVLVAMPPQEEAYRGAEVLRNAQPLSGPLDKHTIVYRFVAPVRSSEQGTRSSE